MSTYDSHYQTPDLFGEPYPALLHFFGQHSPTSNHLLDLGCGQGRNAIPLARMGYAVTGVDLSQVGIDQMMQVAKAESLPVQGMRTDIFAFDSFHHFDFILLDSMFHFGKREKEQETGLIRSIFSQAKERAKIVFCIQDSGKKVQILQAEIHRSQQIKLLQESSFQYTFEDKQSGHSSQSAYQMLVVEKTL